MTNREIVRKVPCPTCGAVVGKMCGLGAGRLRAEPHPKRTENAGASTMGNMLSFFGMKKKPS